MNKIVECVPNFSEGRDEAKIKLIVNAIASVPDVLVLDREMDADHNRSVITFAGEPDAVVEAAFRGAATAVELIDLNLHHGEHPRIGALDVLPFIPVKGVTMDECVLLARHAAERIARELRIPVFLYEYAALRPDRIDLSDVRRGQFETLRKDIATDPQRFPDFGEAKLHPTAGAMAVGARPPLIAYNINLATEDLAIAKKIAKAIRGRDGGLQHVKALGIELKNRRQVQVSMNLVNHELTPIFRVFEMVKREAARYGVNIACSEIVGLVPQSALNACGDFYLQIDNFSEGMILEHRLNKELEKIQQEVDRVRRPERESQAVQRLSNAGSDFDIESPTIDGFANEVAEGALTPDGSSVAAYAGALAASLGLRVCNLTIGQKASVEAEVRGVLNQLEQLSANLQLSMSEVEESRVRVLDAMALPRETEAERLARTTAFEEATKNAIAVPLRVAKSSVEVLELLSELAEIGNPTAFADLATGAQLAMASVRGATYSVLSQLLQINDKEFNRNRRNELGELVMRGQEIADEIEDLSMSLLPR